MFKYCVSILFKIGLFGLFSSHLLAAEQTLQIIDLANGQTIFQEGDFKTADSPCSTFKIPLALMGFDQHILTSEHTPLWPYKDEYAESRKEVMMAIDPSAWLEKSAVWYSQEITRSMGENIFKQYVEHFNYGNRNVSGDPGKNNGLTRSWLSSSLTISPEEQTLFLRQMLQNQLPVSVEAVEMTKRLMPVFTSHENWTIYGKTGSCSTHKADHKKMPVGWFVGWAEKKNQTLIFAIRLINSNGIKARETLLTNWPDYVAPK